MNEMKGVAPIVIGLVIILAIVAAAAAWYLSKPEVTEEKYEWYEGKQYPNHTQVNLETETPFVGWVGLGLSNPWGELNRKAFEWYCGDVLGWDYEVAWPGCDITKQNNMAEALIKKGVDALVVCPLDSTANAKIGEMAKEAGVPVVLYGIDMKNTWPLAFYQRDDHDSGLYCGKYMIEELKEKYGDIQGLKVLHIHGYRGSESDFLRSGGFIDAIAGSGLSVIEVGNSWDATAELSKIRAAMAANPDIVAVYEEMGGFHECVVTSAKDLGWSEDEIKDLVCVNCDFFPVNKTAYEEGHQDYTHLMPTGGYMVGPCLETLKEFWQHGPAALPKIEEHFTVEKYVPELGVDATVPGTNLAPLKWFNDPKWGIAGTNTTNVEGYCPIRPAPCGGYDTPWVVIPDRIVTAADYTEDFIYWNWPVWGVG